MSTPTAPPDRAEDVRAGNASGGGDPPSREIVVGVDGTECGLGAVRWAAQEAARRGAPLRILHAAPYLGHGGTAGAPPPELPMTTSCPAAAARRSAVTASSVTTSVDDCTPGSVCRATV